MTNEYDFLKKQRYEYYKDTSLIVDNEVDDFVRNVVERLNTQYYNILELVNIKQLQAERILELKKQIKDAEESYDKTMKYLNKTRSKLLNLVKGNKNND